MLNSSATSYTNVSAVSELVSALAGSFGSLSDSKGSTTQLQNNGSFTTQTSNFLNSEALDATKPQACLNWVLFDEQFKLVTPSSGNDQVKSTNATTVYSHQQE